MCVCVVLLKTVVWYAALLATPQRVAVKNLEYSGAHPWALIMLSERDYYYKTMAAFHFAGEMGCGKMEWVPTPFSEGQGKAIFSLLGHPLFIG